MPPDLDLPAGTPSSPPRGMTPAEVSRLLRVSPDRVRAWIVAGELGAIDTARVRCGRPRYVILPQHLVEFARRRAAAAPRPATRRRRRRPEVIDYYPD
jgi:Helix-turn-helix domain